MYGRMAMQLDRISHSSSDLGKSGKTGRVEGEDLPWKLIRMICVCGSWRMATGYDDAGGGDQVSRERVVAAAAEAASGDG